MQRFDGEDLSAGDRKKAQRAQAAEWWAEQAALKAGSKAAEAEAQMAHDEFVRYQDMVQQTARAQEAAARRGMNEATLEINRQLAEERRLREAQARDAELAANMAELDATMMSRLMTEDPTLAASVLSQVGALVWGGVKMSCGGRSRQRGEGVSQCVTAAQLSMLACLCGCRCGSLSWAPTWLSRFGPALPDE
eukprot:366097-Chlamydomonas_euryale.AAC.42